LNRNADLLTEVLKDFKPEDIFNLDETGLYYHCLPIRSIRREKKKGGKISKERFTNNFIVNAIGSKIYIQVIRKLKKLRFFGTNFDPGKSL